MLSSANSLTESFLPSEIYNQLPRICLDTVWDQEKDQFMARRELLQVIADNGLDDIFGIHTLHRHYDLPTNHIMVYEQNPSPGTANIPFFEICRTRRVDQLSLGRRLRGKFFFYRPDMEIMSAYEFTTEDLPDVDGGKYQAFVNKFIHRLLELKMDRVFALSVLPPQKERRILHEIEIPEYSATLRLESANWVPDGFNTDWMLAPAMEGSLQQIPANGSFRQMSNGGKHAASKKTAQHSSIGFIDPVTDSTSLGIAWDDSHMLPGSAAYNLVAQARDFIIS